MATYVDRQRVYRQRLAERGAVSGAGAKASRGAPETRFVVQSLASAVRSLAAEIKANPDVAKAQGAAFQALMRAAGTELEAKGFDRAESASRLLLYVLPNEQRRRRLARDAEARYWSPPPPPGMASKTGADKR